MKVSYQIPSVICLYDGADVEHVDLERIADYLGQWFDRDRIEIRSEFFRYHLDLSGRADEQFIDSLAERLCSARIREPSGRVEDGVCQPEEIAQERKWLLEGGGASDIFYDGLLWQRACLDLIGDEESSAEFLHIAFTNRLLGTWDKKDRRYHGRVGIYGLPCIISTSGIVEGPAKPREYYFRLMAGLNAEQAKGGLEDRFVDYGDRRLTELLKGYTMQAVFYHLLAEPFCEDRDCRLFNAHWQEEMIRAQLGTSAEFCPKHRKLLEGLPENKK